MPVNQRSPSAERAGTAMYVLPATSEEIHANLSAFGPFVANLSAFGPFVAKLVTTAECRL